VGEFGGVEGGDKSGIGREVEDTWMSGKICSRRIGELA